MFWIFKKKMFASFVVFLFKLGRSTQLVVAVLGFLVDVVMLLLVVALGLAREGYFGVLQ